MDINGIFMAFSPFSMACFLHFFTALLYRARYISMLRISRGELMIPEGPRRPRQRRPEAGRAGAAGRGPGG